MRSLTQDQINIILSKVMQFDPHDVRYPTAVCGKCRIVLSEYSRGIYDHAITLPDYSVIGRPSRSRDSECECYICKVAKSTSNPNLMQGHVFPWREKGESSESRSCKKLCAKCLSEYARGKTHQCSKTTLKHNLSEIQSQTSDNEECLGAQGIQISSQDFARIQSELNLSRNKTLKLGQEMRKVSQNRLSIEPHLKSKLYDISHFLDSQFEVKTCDFFDNSGDQYFRPVVYCKDLQKLIDLICTTRGFDHDNVFIKLSLDGGGGFVKVMISVFSMNDENAQPGRRNDTSVKKIFLILIAPEVDENYRNVLQMFVTLKLKDLGEWWKIVSDLKLANIILGLMAHGSTHPCSYCDVDKSKLDKEGQLR